MNDKENFYRNLIDTAYDWEELLDPDNRFLYVSPACERISGYRPEEFLADPGLLRSIVHPGDRELMEGHWHEVFHSVRDELHCLDFRIIARDGEIRWINHCCRPLFDDQGVFIGRRGSNRDITERKRTEQEHHNLAERYQLLNEEFEVANEELRTQNDEVNAYAKKLEFQEKKLYTILSSMEDYVYIVDRDGRCRYVNASVARAAASDPDDLIGVSIEDIWSRAGVVMESGESFREGLATAFLTGTTQTGENIFRYPAGFRWRLYTIHPLPDEHGELGSALVTSRDITGMKEAEQELKRSHRELMDIIEFLPDATFVLDDRQQVIAWNRAMESMTSIPKDRMLGKGNYEYAVPFYGEARPMLPDFVIQAKRDVGHLYDLFDSSEDTLIAEAYAPGFNGGGGAHFWAKASVIRDDAGRVIGAIETIRDISARKREESEMLRKNAELSVLNEKLGTLYEELAETEEELRQNYDEIVKGERALRETTQYLENLIGYANAPIIVWDPEYRITRFNYAFERLTGRTRHTMIGSPLDRLFPETSREELMDRVRKTSSGERFESVEIPIIGADGKSRTVLWNSATLYEADGTTVLSTIAQGQDITERKQAEEELALKNEELVTLNEDLAEKEEELRQYLDELEKSERALRETTQYLENLIGYANAPIIVWDPEFRITRFNRAFERLTGKKSDLVIGQPLEILFPDESSKESMNLIQRTSAGERFESVEIPVLHTDGTVRTVLWNSATLYEADGTTVRSVIAQGQDITERKQAEEELALKNEELVTLNEDLREKEEELRRNYEELSRAEQILRENREMLASAEEIARLGSWDLDLVTNRLNWSDEVFRIFGLRPQEFGATYDAFLEAVHPEDRDAVDAAYSGSLLKGVDAYEIEHRIVRRDNGEERFVHEKCKHFRDGTGTIIRSVGMVHDITERKQVETDLALKNEELVTLNEDLAEKEEELRENLDELGKSERALRETTQYLENLIGYANAPVIVWDPEYRITRFNRAFEVLIGRTAEEVIGRPLDILFPGKCRETNMNLIRRTSTGERWETVEIPVLTVNGETRTVLWNSATLYEADGTTVLSTIAQGVDITERKEMNARLRKKADELARSNEELERFAYVASHDLREPLRMVTSFSQLLQQRYQSRLDTDADEFIHYVVDGGKRMDALVNDLLEFSRINSRAKPLEPTDMNIVVEDALRGLSIAIEESGASIEVECLPTVPVDRTQMTQVFQNLLSNAIKFRGENAPLIRIGATQTETEWVFSVQDNGIGIDPSYAEAIFEIFKRLHTKEEYPGTGIGLAISRRIIERHGGRIGVKSDIGKGSTFTFTIPAGN